MNEELITMLVVPIIFVCMAMVILMGKGDRFISTLRRLSPEERARFNIVRVRILHAVLLLLLAIAVPLFIYFDVREYIALSVILPTVVVAMVLFYTWCKR